jgi:hypothetical protein
VNGWTDGQDTYMAVWRGETVEDQREAPDEDMDEREEREEERAEPEVMAPPPRRYMTIRQRALARLGNHEGCLICQGEACWCGVAERLSDLTCGHAGAGICRWCLAEFLMLSERGSTTGADFQAHRLVAAQRLRRRVARSAA